MPLLINFSINFIFMKSMDTLFILNLILTRFYLLFYKRMILTLFLSAYPILPAHYLILMFVFLF